MQVNGNADNSDRQIGRIDSLTGARFPAIMIIVFSHFEFLSKYGSFGEMYSSWWHNPTMGVDFFFMLSGFGMMLGSMKRDPEGAVSVAGIRGMFEYARRHVRKIYPVYFLMLLFGIIYEIIIGLSRGTGLLKEIVKCVIFFPLDLTLLQSLTGSMTFSHSLNGDCWFLSSLFCIYLISPLIMQGMKRRVRTVSPAVLGFFISTAAAVLLAFLFGCIENIVGYFNDLVYGSPYRRLFYVIPGMFLAQIFNFHKKDVNYRMSSFLSSGFFEYLVILFSMVWFFIRHLLIGSIVYAIDILIVAGDLYAIAIGKGRISKLLESRYMVYLGNMAMYFFVTHYLIRMYVDSAVQMLGIGSIPVAIGEVILILVLSGYVSVRLYKKNGEVKLYNEFSKIFLKKVG